MPVFKDLIHQLFVTFSLDLIIIGQGVNIFPKGISKDRKVTGTGGHCVFWREELVEWVGYFFLMDVV